MGPTTCVTPDALRLGWRLHRLGQRLRLPSRYMQLGMRRGRVGDRSWDERSTEGAKPRRSGVKCGRLMTAPGPVSEATPRGQMLTGAVSTNVVGRPRQTSRTRDVLTDCCSPVRGPTQSTMGARELGQATGAFPSARLPQDLVML
ncbi:hypothetical protein PSPO01_10091 [Paraphaeosphaeria sporulosa]